MDVQVTLGARPSNITAGGTPNATPAPNPQQPMPRNPGRGGRNFQLPVPAN